jgi:hypothetical protein
VKKPREVPGRGFPGSSEGGIPMTVDEGLRGVAGLFILASVALGHWVSPWFYAFTAFVGLNLFQSAFSRWCPMMWLLEKAGLRRG